VVWALQNEVLITFANYSKKGVIEEEGTVNNSEMGGNMRKVTLAVLATLAIFTFWIGLHSSIQPPYESFAGHYKTLVQADAPSGNGYGGTLIFDSSRNQLWVNTAALGQLGSTWANTFAGVYPTLTASFTDSSSSSNLQAITGLSFTIPAGVAQIVPINCNLAWTQATQVSDSFGIQDSVAPTSIDGFGIMSTAGTGSSPAIATGFISGLNTTTATAIVTGTPTVSTANYVNLNFTVQQPSGSSAATIQLMVKQSTAADVIVVLKGSNCTLW
jgi:hypothetical protein